MHDELAARQRAITLRLAGRPIKAVGRSEVWFPKGWGRYLLAGPEGLYDLTRANHHVAQRISPELERTILSIRRRLQAHATPATRYSLIGATAILGELTSLGIRPRPSARTIERVEIGTDQLAVLQPEAGIVDQIGHAAGRIDGIVGTCDRARFRLDDGDTITEALLEHKDARQARVGRGECDVELHGTGWAFCKWYGARARSRPGKRPAGRHGGLWAARLGRALGWVSGRLVSLHRASSVRVQERPSRRRQADQHASARNHFAYDKATVDGLLPNRQAGTGGPPGLHHLGVLARRRHEPLEQVEDQGIEAMVMIVPAAHKPTSEEKAAWSDQHGAASWLNLSNAFIQCMMMQNGNK